jgi:queuine tRNA-ribosyltransferase
MGVGHPADLVTYARLGVDLFDCVLPTRLGRNGTVWCAVEGTRLNLARRSLLGENGPIMAGCTCATCETWSLGVLAALFQNREPLAYRLASVHNLAVLGRVARDLRQAVMKPGLHWGPDPNGRESS